MGIFKAAGFVVLLGSLAFGADATISGVVKGPTGAPFRGAFVRVRNPKNRTTVDVFSDSQGRYRVTNLAPADYYVVATASGYGDDAHNGVTIASGASLSMDFALKAGKVRWSDLTSYQAEQLLPEGKGKELLKQRCFACHQIQTRIAAKAPRSREAWAVAVNKLMREGIKYRMLAVTDQDADETISYLEKYFGPSSTLPAPSDLPGYAALVRPVADEGLKMVYVDYEMPGMNHFPWSANPDNKGAVWIPYFGAQNRIARMDINTAAVEEFKVPYQDSAAGVHSTFPAPDGSVWFAEQGSNRLGKWDPVTRQTSEFVDPDGGGKVTVRVNAQGDVWGSGKVGRLDTKTGKYTHYEEIPASYSLALDKDGNCYYSVLADGKSIGRVDVKTNRVTRWTPPTPHAYPRRLNFDSQGFLWFGEYEVGKLGRFDPKTETFKEYVLPGPSPKPYALGIDKKDRVWYSSMDQDVIGLLDPKTGKIVEYPTPYSENAMREFFMDNQGRMWFGTAPNNRVGYFIPENY